MTDTEREDFSALLMHPGWLRLVAYAKGQWGGSAYKAKVKQAMARAQQDRTDLASAVMVVDAVSDELNVLLSYPTDRVRALEVLAEHNARPSPSRRGGL